jgi:hypothetical protein
MLKSKFFVLSMAMLVSTTASAGNELFVSEGASGKVRLVGLDVLVQPPAVGFEVRMTVPEGARVDTSRCMQGLSGLQIASCVFNGKEVVVLALREGLKPFAEAMLSLGTIEIHGGGDGAPSITTFLVSDPAGQPLDSAVRAADKPSAGDRVERLR